jgi:hypothetical protein
MKIPDYFKGSQEEEERKKWNIHELRAHGKLADFLDPLHFVARFCVLTHLLLFQHSHPMHICRHTATSTRENPETTDAYFIHEQHHRSPCHETFQRKRSEKNKTKKHAVTNNKKRKEKPDLVGS